MSTSLSSLLVNPTPIVLSPESRFLAALPVHFTKWKPFDLDAVSHRADLALASGDNDRGMGGATDANAPVRLDPE
jgi:hypothetical protein